MTDEEFRVIRRQKFIDLTSFENTLIERRQVEQACLEVLADPNVRGMSRWNATLIHADTLWENFQLNCTAGISLDHLRESLSEILVAYETHGESCDALTDNRYIPPFMLTEMIDIYVDYLNILSAAVLLHREDLVPRIFALIEGTDFDGADAVLEEIFRIYIPGRPQLDEWLYPQYRLLLDAIDSDNAPEMEAEMAKYVKKWYPSMKGKAHFLGQARKNNASIFALFRLLSNVCSRVHLSLSNRRCQVSERNSISQGNAGLRAKPSAPRLFRAGQDTDTPVAER